MNKLLVLRQQAWFRPFVEVGDLPLFPTGDITRVRLQDLGKPYLRLIVGKGPVSHALPALFTAYFEHGEKDYPTFECPGIGPPGSALMASPDAKTVEASEEQALLLADVVVVYPVAPEWLDQFEHEEITAGEGGMPCFGANNRLVVQQLSALREILDVAIGAYALYQYPVVWRPIAHTYDVLVLDPSEKSYKNKTPFNLDNFVPCMLRLAPKLDGANLKDAVGRNLGALAGMGLHVPFLLLQETLWQDNINMRFIHEFWILEHLVSMHGRELKPDPAIEEFAHSLEAVVGQQFPSFLGHFKSRKGALIQPTLTQKLSAYAKDRGFEFDEKIFVRAKQLRNEISHGEKVDSDEITYVETFFRELVWRMVRTEMEARGVTLRESDGD
jgi:hypothetical protein